MSYSYYSVKRKGRRYWTAVNDDRMGERTDNERVRTAVGPKASEMCENVWEKADKDAGKRLKALGYVWGGKAKNLMEYMVEQGHIK